jgi:hypothetical protein
MATMDEQRQRERYRRFPIKLSYSALILVLGPSDAWNESAAIGLLTYLAVYIFFKLVTAELASKSNNWVMKSYRFSPLFLFIGGILPVTINFGDPNYDIISRNMLYTIVVPALFGAYEGAYWTGYHEIRNFLKNPNQSDSQSIAHFQQMEVICTVAGALIAACLKSLESTPEELPGAIAAILALCAFSIRWDRNIMQPRNIIGTTTRVELIQSVKHISGPYAVVQFVVVNAMRFVALQVGVLYLGLLVALAEASGYAISRFSKAWKELQKRVMVLENRVDQLSPYPTPLKESSLPMPIEHSLWMNGYVAVFIGIAVMILGNFIGTAVFVVGWFIAQGSIRGVMRPEEIALAEKIFKKDGWGEVKKRGYPLEKGIFRNKGLRERLKFRSHFKFAAIFITASMICEKYDYLELDYYLIYPWLSFGLWLSWTHQGDARTKPEVYFADSKNQQEEE